MSFSSLARGVAIVAAGALALGLTACAGSAPAPAEDGSEGLGTLKVGALPVPAGDILKWVSDNLAEDAGLTIEWQEFTDYNTPNPALSDGSVDANLFQNSTFLETYNEQSGDDLISVGEIYLPAAAFYSEKLDSLDDLDKGATIAIPNDPTNEGRALKLLAAEGIIEISDGATTLAEITENPKDLQFVEIENASLALALPDNDAAFVTASFAIPAGLSEDQAILLEGTDSKYYNILATRADMKDDPRIEALVELLNDDRTKEYILETWKGLIVPVD
ncbi:MetQ/NlpA family ABC transporter substrate-binding protein [Microbacterium murale]|uniref:Lipoprotein n=1 Tax=Microbacterium murale TaxID=1081040 RepID=A0ABU0P4L4_9MICO|nr:MetQ/NlpA family ABC transporter substrate-binding protein [Microbacterium murale]MDQ0642271.1 D-methionine transport system substrate-binding protein [Microbacterium murale]